MILTTAHTTSVDATPTQWVALARDIGRQISPHAAELDRAGEFVHESFGLIRETGLSSMLVPSEFGGGGATHAEACAVLTELGRACSATAVTLSMHFHLVATQVWRHKHGQPAETVLTKVARERIILISTGASDWVDASGNAIAVEGGYRISARKSPSSGCPTGDVLVTSIPWADGPDGPCVIHCSVPFSAQGLSIEKTWDTLGLRSTGSDTVVLDDVFVPDSAVSLIRPAGQWHPAWNAVLGSALPLIMAAYIGIGEAAVATATTMASAKASQPHVAPLVGEMYNHLATAQDAVQSMTLRSDDLQFDNTDDHAAFVLTRKTVAAEALIKTVRTAIDIAGGAGYSKSFDLERLYRDVHGGTFHPLPAAKQVLFTGRHAMGLDTVTGA
jgi:alkylation response protein AidB-like acyl-CoA dehydrogenase